MPASGSVERPGFFRDVLDRLPDVVVVYRADRVLYANDAACRLLGYPDGASLLAASPMAPIDPVDLDEVRARSARLAAGEPVEARATRFRRPDGGVVVLEVVSHPIDLDGGPGVLAVGRDLSERQDDQERRLQADRAQSIGTLAAGVAHEINNPLTFVVANLSYAIGELRAAAEGAGMDVPDLVEALTEAQEGAERIRRIVHELRTFRLEDPRDDRVDVRKVLATSVNLAASEIRARAVLGRDLREVPAVLASEGRLGQVFLNLLMNAVHAIPPGESDANEVRVACFADGAGWVVVEVRDTGAGMAPDVLARIFDPFFTTKAGGGGTGLGLAISQRIVTGFGGDITVESAPGEGSTFRVRLPAAPTADPVG